MCQLGTVSGELAGDEHMMMPEPTFARVALDHLQMVEEDTALAEIRMHCYFARRFLKLALDGEETPPITTVTIAPRT